MRRSKTTRRPWRSRCGPIRRFIICAVAMRERGDTEGAIELLRKAVEMSPNYAEMQHALGVLLRDAGRASEAIPLLERAVQLAPLQVIAREDLARALLMDDQTGRPVDQLLRAVQLAPASGSAHCLLGTALGQQGDLDGAIVEFKTALSIDEHDQAAADNLKKALEAKRQSSE